MVGTTAESHVVRVPTSAQGQMGHVAVNVLQDDVADIFDLLKSEAANLKHWIEVALAYYNNDMPKEYERVMKEAYENMNFLPFTEKEDRLKVMNSLGAYYTTHIQRAKSKTKDKDARKYLELANAYSQQAMTLDSFDGTTLAVKAFAYYAAGDKSSALNFFDMALGQDKKNVSALIGKALIAYKEGKYTNALDWYSQALTQNEDCPVFVRLGMGYCWYKLKNVEKAKKCFQRVVDLDPSNVTGLVGLALVDLDPRNREQFEKSVKYLKTAFAIEKNHPIILNTFADHLFHNSYALQQAKSKQGATAVGDYLKAEELARRASENTNNPQVKALAWFQIGRCKHAQGDLEEATKYYFQAVSISSELPLAHYALGQLYIWKDQPEEAIKQLQAVLKIAPEDADTLMTLGQLHVQMGQTVEAARIFRKVTEQHKDIIDAWCLLGYTRRFDAEFSLQAYANAAKLIQAKGDDLPTKVMNDVAVLHHKTGLYADAIRLYRAALAKEGGNTDDFEEQHLPMVYNIARVMEDQGTLDEAFQAMRKILEKFPSYMECYMGLARICIKKQDKDQAAKWLEMAMNVDQSRAEPWLMLADTYASNKEFIRAQDKYEYILKKIDKRNSHAQLGMGFMYLNALQHANLPEKEEKFSRLAADFYQKVLHKDASNIYAAHGLACFMAFRGHYEDARKALARVNEADFVISEGNGREVMLINLANCHTMLGNYGVASKMYLNILNKYPSCVQKYNLYALLGHSLFGIGDFNMALSYLQKALRVDPNNQRLWFNLAMTQKMVSLLQLQELNPGKLDGITVEHYDKCQSTVDLMNLASRNFERVKEHYSKHKHHPLYNYAHENVKGLAAKLPSAELCLEQAKDIKAKDEVRLKKFRQQQQRIEMQKRKQAAEEARKKQLEAEKMRTMIEEDKKRLEEIRVRVESQQEQEKAAEAKRVREKAAVTRTIASESLAVGSASGMPGAVGGFARKGPSFESDDEDGMGGQEEEPDHEYEYGQEESASSEDDAEAEVAKSGKKKDKSKKKDKKDKKDKKKDKKDKKKDKKEKKEKKHKKDKERKKDKKEKRKEKERDQEPDAEPEPESDGEEEDLFNAGADAGNLKRKRDGDEDEDDMLGARDDEGDATQVLEEDQGPLKKKRMVMEDEDED